MAVSSGNSSFRIPRDTSIPRNRNNDNLTNRRKQEKKEGERKYISGAHIPLGIPKVSEKKEGVKRREKEITPQ